MVALLAACVQSSGDESLPFETASLFYEGIGCDVGYRAGAAAGRVDGKSCAFDLENVPRLMYTGKEVIDECRKLNSYAGQACYDNAADPFADCAVGGYYAGYTEAADGCGLSDTAP